MSKFIGYVLLTISFIIIVGLTFIAFYPKADFKEVVITTVCTVSAVIILAFMIIKGIDLIL